MVSAACLTPPIENHFNSPCLRVARSIGQSDPGPFLYHTWRGLPGATAWIGSWDDLYFFQEICWKIAFGVKPMDFVILLSHICSCLHSKGLFSTCEMSQNHSVPARCQFMCCLGPMVHHLPPVNPHPNPHETSWKFIPWYDFPTKSSNIRYVIISL